MRIRTFAVAYTAIACALVLCTFPHTPSLSAQSVDPLDAAHLRRLTLTELSRVGGDDDREGYMLSSVSLAAALSPDRFVIIDSGSREVRVYGTDGLVRMVTGRAGEGPGEFKTPSGIGVIDNGDLLVFDMRLRRVVTFDPEGEVVSTGALPTADPMAIFSSSFAGGLPDGTWVLREGSNPIAQRNLPDGPVRDTTRFLHMSPSGETLGEIAAVVGPEEIMMHQGTSWGTRSPIFGRGLLYAVSEDDLLVGINDSILLRRYSPTGKALEPFSVHRPPHRATRRDIADERQRRKDEAKALQERLKKMSSPFGGSFGEEEAKRSIEVAEKIRAEDTWPAFRTIKAGPGGEVWIEDVNAAGVKTHRWIRFTDGFRPDGWIELPEGDALLAVGHGLALVRTEDELDVQTVVCYRVGTP